MQLSGTGRPPRVEASFLPRVIDQMVAVPDAASIAATRVLSAHLGRPCGGSTGMNLWAYAHVIADMRKRGEAGSVVSILCDSGDRYRSSYFDDAWVAARGLSLDDAAARLRAFIDDGVF